LSLLLFEGSAYNNITYRVRIGWNGRDSGLFKLDVSSLDGPDVLTDYRFNPQLIGANDDVTADALNFTVKYGYDKLQSQFRTGTLDLALLDKGKYNPVNASSVLNGKIRPMRPVVVDCSLDGGVTFPWPIFTGWGRMGDSNQDYGVMAANFHAEDTGIWLNTQYPVIPSMGRTTTAAALTAIFKWMGLTNPAKMLFDTGDSIPDFSADGTNTAIDLINNLMQACLGVFFFGPDGTAIFYDRNHWAKQISIGTMTTVSSTIPGWDLTPVINQQKVTRTGGVTQWLEDADSRDEFGPMPGGDISTGYLLTDADALDRVRVILTRSSSPLQALWGIDVLQNADPNNIPALLSSKPFDRLTLANTVNTDGDYSIVNVTHKGAGGELHKTTWGLSFRPTTAPLILDTTPLDVSYLGV
jgi:hypothetical protein